MIASGPDYPLLRRVLRPPFLAPQSREAAPGRAAGRSRGTSSPPAMNATPRTRMAKTETRRETREVAL